MSILNFFKKVPLANDSNEIEDHDECSASCLDQDVADGSASAADNTSIDSDCSSDSYCSSVDEDCDTPPPKRPNLSNEDISDVADIVQDQTMSAQKRYKVLTTNFKQSPGYSFPKGVNGRSFQHKWLQRFPWLAYSKRLNGGFCIPCVLFSSVGYQNSVPGVLVSRPLTTFSKALEECRKHLNKEYHKIAITRSEEFLKTMTNQQPSIQSQLNKSIADRIALNRLKLASILKTIVFCGRQNIALRGHRDNSTDIERDITGCTNHGNFRALLSFRVDAGDEVLREHLASGAMYTSSNIQNHLIQVVSEQVRQKILRKVLRARWFTVIADEVTDISNKEQLSIVLRYVDPDTKIVREYLVGFFECDTGISGRDLSEKITSCVETYGLDLSNLRGQCYDGAGNMAGSVNGTAALITRQYPLALYLHCASHCLNLAVVKSLEVTSVRNMMSVVGRVYQFFAAHPKRQRAIEKAIDETTPSSAIHKVKNMCRTRWVQRIDAINVFQSLHQSLVVCMQSICDEGPRLWSRDSITDANGLKLAITTTEFISALVITNACLKYLQALTTNLQAEAKDIVIAVKEINNVMATLQSVRDDMDTHHEKWFRSVEKMCTDIGLEPSLPRVCGRQTHRTNIPANTPSQFFCRSISIPILDHILSELKSRFTAHQQTALHGLCLIPSILVEFSEEECTTKVDELVHLYQDDLPSSDSISSELHCWIMKWNADVQEHGPTSLPFNLSSTLSQTSSMFPNIQSLLCILCTLPVTSCSAERSFSGLKRIKTATRSSMTTERLTGLSLIHIHRDIPIDIDSAIDEFARLHPRRMKMINILDD